MWNVELCMVLEELWLTNFGDENSKRISFGPGLRWTSALK